MGSAMLVVGEFKVADNLKKTIRALPVCLPVLSTHSGNVRELLKKVMLWTLGKRNETLLRTRWPLSAKPLPSQDQGFGG